MHYGLIFVFTQNISFWFLVFASNLSRRYKKHIDWKVKYNLSADSILSLSEITKMDKTLESFVRFTEGEGIEGYQKDICNIQLIPRVPEDVKKVFQRAKDLYIYGFFRYNFYTISQHYAYLALESAIKNRYYQSFGNNILLTCNDETVKINRLDHQLVIDICSKKKGWNVRKIKINEEKFAYSTGELLNWLNKKGIINLWEKKLCKRG
ncbi:unnamed protein product, partial [marine sediment metagenome]